MKRKTIILGLSIILIFLLSVLVDSIVSKNVSLIGTSTLNQFFLNINIVGSGVIFAFFMICLFIWRKNKRRWLIPLLFSMGISTLFSFVLKISIQRPRPFQAGIVEILPGLEKASHFIWNYSFPSFHAMLAFCTVPFLSKEFPKLKYLWIIFAGVIAFSRIYFGLHFLSDVIAGSSIGYLIGLIILKTEEENKYVKKIYEKFQEIFKK